jgi:hypothetical protein
MYQYQILKNYFNIFLNKKYIKKKKTQYKSQPSPETASRREKI